MPTNQTKFKETEIGPIPEEWEVVNIDEALNIIDGDRGANYPNGSDFSDNGFCLFLNAKNVCGDSFDFSSSQFISQIKDSELRKGKMQRGDFVLTTRGTVGNIAFYDKSVPFENIRINSGMVILRNNNDFESKYLFQLLKSVIIKKQISELTTGSAQPQLPIRDLKNLKLIKPRISEQKQIAEILSSLDDKIELNRKINANLEKLEATLFKKWFVDIGDELPEGWKLTELKNILELNYGKALKAENRKDGHVKVYGSSGFVGFHDTKLVDGPGIIVGRKGNVGSVFWSNDDFYPIDTTYFVKSKLPLTYCYHLLKNQTFVNGDSVVPGLNRDQAYRIEVVLPSTDALEKFDTIASDIRKSIMSVEREIEILSTMRDSLLLRLLNGKIRV